MIATDGDQRLAADVRTGKGPVRRLGPCQHGGVTTTNDSGLRAATARDCVELLRLWALLFDEDNAAPAHPWRSYAAEWFTRFVDDPSSARFPVIEIGGAIVATAIGTPELRVPNPPGTQGRTARLMNVITLPGHRRPGYGMTLVLDALDRAQCLDADRLGL